MRSCFLAAGAAAPWWASRHGGRSGNAGVQIHADALTQMLAGRLPQRPALALPIEAAAALLIAIAGIAGLRRHGAIFGLGFAAIGGLVWLATSYGLFARSDQLLDPLSPPLVGGFAFLAASIAGYAETRAREERLRQRFEQRLAPEVVRRIAAIRQL